MSTDVRRSIVGDLARDWRALLCVCAIYVTFLLFAQFGFLRQLERDLATAAGVRSAMTCMGVAGLLASLATAMLLGRVAAADVLRVGLGASAAVAVLSLACHGVWSLRLVGALVGVSIGIATVALAASLRDAIASPRLALTAGVGTGVAYLVCNLPPLFDGEPWLRAIVPAALCLVALPWVPTWSSDAHPRDVPRAAETPGLARVLPIFLVLVWLDSTAFAIVQQTPDLKAVSWGGDHGTLVQGVTHLATAIVAGALLDRGRLLALLGTTWALFAIGLPLLQAGGASAARAAPLYAAGISVYSVALVAYPSMSGRDARWRAALLYGVAGWLGSGLGVGMAQDLRRVPPAFIVVTGVVVASACVAPGPLVLRKAARLYGPAVLIGIVGAVLVLRGASWLPLARADGGAARETAVERGRAVYVSEGCVHCHSQYVRPVTTDEAWWGPSRAVTRDRRLIGDRRQGPDLLNVGNRRSPEWHEIHLRDPRLLSPGSRMPSYAALFDDGGTRAADLVAYLASLGRETVDARVALSRGAAAATAASPSASRGSALFTAYCAACHGVTGRGDGVLARRFDAAAMNLAKPRLWFVAPGAEPRATALARIVRYGLPGTPMPGHESLPDRDVADLVAFVESLDRSTAMSP